MQPIERALAPPCSTFSKSAVEIRESRIVYYPLLKISANAVPDMGQMCEIFVSPGSVSHQLPHSALGREIASFCRQAP